MTPQLVLVAGPYRSGTDGAPARIAANLRRLEAAALAVHRRGHVPMIGEWVSLPLAVAAD
ncbi:NUDIX hydrolase [Burkholderia pseudomultivorans]|uniref:NUDIX hydrolase n=1 Tax=Burkholderia pseudomultivorans TaxID=1207504 RepID=A0A6P2K7E7_9BURK|nr:NUDIX hydrolase [Burkholderia pseudomultivorans]